MIKIMFNQSMFCYLSQESKNKINYIYLLFLISYGLTIILLIGDYNILNKLINYRLLTIKYFIKYNKNEIKFLQLKYLVIKPLIKNNNEKELKKVLLKLKDNNVNDFDAINLNLSKYYLIMVNNKVVNKVYDIIKNKNDEINLIENKLNIKFQI